MIFAPAKINLGLRITGRYADGYHRLESLFIPLTLYDCLTVQRAAYDAVSHAWPDYVGASLRRELGLGALKNPLLMRALMFARAVIRDETGSDMAPMRVRVTKRIPSPSGLGGASSDAAALIALSLGRFGVKRLPEKAWPQLSRIGADVPFFLRHGLAGRGALLTGVGHELAACRVPQFAGVLVVPPFGFSTQQMYAHMRTRDLPPVATESALQNVDFTLRLNEIPCSDELAAGVRHVFNDFDTAAEAVFPAEFALLKQAKQTLALTVSQALTGEWYAGMTGSGAGLFALTTKPVAAGHLRWIATVLGARLSGWQVFPVRSHTVS